MILSDPVKKICLDVKIKNPVNYYSLFGFYFYMGKFLSRFPSTTCFRCREKEIISDDSLEAVKEIISRLRNGRILANGLLFRADAIAHQGVVNEIVAAIEAGAHRTVCSMLDAGWRLEASQALYTYLTRLNQPLIPASIQSLALDENNTNVAPEVVASDVLGLLREELSLKHRELIASILQLLDRCIKVSPADELRGHTLPVSMLPLFFNIENYHFMHEWRRILAIFVELIKQGQNVLMEESESESFL